MSFYTGQDGSLHFDGTKVARVQSWSITASATLNSDTKVGDCVKKYKPGATEYRGNALVWYYADAPKPLLERLFNTSDASDSAAFSLRWGGKKLDFNGIVSSATITCQSGAVMQANIQFVVDGNLTTVSL